MLDIAAGIILQSNRNGSAYLQSQDLKQRLAWVT